MTEPLTPNAAKLPLGLWINADSQIKIPTQHDRTTDTKRCQSTRGPLDQRRPSNQNPRHNMTEPLTPNAAKVPAGLRINADSQIRIPTQHDRTTDKTLPKYPWAFGSTQTLKSKSRHNMTEPLTPNAAKVPLGLWIHVDSQIKIPTQHDRTTDTKRCQSTLGPLDPRRLSNQNPDTT